MTVEQSKDPWGELMRAALAGDESAYRRLLGELAQTFRTMARARLARFGQGNADIEDIVQETLLAIHLKRDSWDTNRPLAPWAQAILAHKISDRTRQQASRPQTPLDDAHHAIASPQGDPDAASDIDRLLARLPSPQRRLVDALTLKGRSASEVAAETGATEGAVRVALHRALKRLAALYREERQ